MKFTKLILTLAAFILTASLRADTSFTVTGTAEGATNSYAVIRATGNGTPSIYNFQASVKGSDATNLTAGTVALNYYTAGPPIPISAASAAGVTTLSTTTNGLTPVSGIIVLHHVAGDTYELLSVATITTGAITINAATATATTTSDKIYKMTLAGKYDYVFPGGYAYALAEWKVISPAPIFAGGVQGRPVLLRLIGTASDTLNTVTGVFNKESVVTRP